MKNYYFLSGLPRSGSTLLQSILSENPKFHCEGNSPMMIYLRAMHHAVQEQGKEQLDANQKHQIAHNIVKSIPNLYYTNTERPYILDKSRAWTHTFNLNLIKEYINPNPKIIVMVRPIEEILISFANMYKVNKRVDYSLNAMLVRGTDPIMKAYECLLMALQESNKHCIFITYDYLINNPEETLNAIYRFLELEPYKHDFSNIQNRYKENDNVYGLTGLHEVRKEISKNKYDIELSPDIVEFCKNLNKNIGL